MSPNTEQATSFFGRVIANDSFRKGVAGAVAGALVSVFSELLFPTGS